MTYKSNESKFISEWSVIVEKGGYYQLPNDFTHNIALLGLTAIDALIIIDILSYGTGRRVAVVTICQDLGVSEKSVRNSFRKLSQHKYMHRSYGKGMPSFYSFSGLKKLVEELAQNRQAGIHDLHRGVGKKYQNPAQDIHTNKEANTKIFIKEQKSYEQLLRDRDELANDKSV